VSLYIKRKLAAELLLKKSHPLECIFSSIEMASMAMQATISMDILKLKRKEVNIGYIENI
jgi:hypothetical protein